MMVVSIVAIVGVLAFTLLTVSLITYRMKNTNMRTKDNFYSAESVIENISLGLQKDISDASAAAYAWTLEHFSANDADAGAEYTRKKGYVSKFQDELLDRISGTANPAVGSSTYVLCYSEQHLSDMVDADAKKGSIKCSVAAAGGKNVINQDINAATFTIKNLVVDYVDSAGYETQIQTDIVLACPQLDFSQTNTAPLDLTAYTLVANEKAKTDKQSVTIQGSAYLGNQGAEISGGSITFKQPNNGGSSRIVTADNLLVKQGGSLTIEDGYQTWARSLVVDAATADVKGTTYLNNDVVVSNSIGSSSKLTMGGRLNAYGNLAATGSAEVYLTNTVTNTKGYTKANDEVDAVTHKLYKDLHPADFSSAVLINGKNCSVDFSGLEEMTIAGNAYVGASLNNADNSDIQMGESISLKSDQRAYLVPAELIAPYCKNGGQNPMTASRFLALQAEIMDKCGYSSANDINPLEYIRSDKDAILAVPDELAKYGVIGVQQAVYHVSLSSGSQPENMVYFFLQFDSTLSANKFAENYWKEDQINHLNYLKGQIYPDFYNDQASDKFSITNPVISYPNAIDLPTDNRFYFNGSILVPDEDSTRFIAGKLQQSSVTHPNLITEEENDQRTYAALRHKLSVEITVAEGNKTVYQNLVVDDMAHLADVTKTGVANGTKTVYCQDGDADSMMCALVVNEDDYVLTTASNKAAVTDAGKTYPLHLVIARGNVTIPDNCEFTGLIIAGGEVTIGQGATLKADSALAQQALCIMKGTTCPADFLIDGELYKSGTADSGSEENDLVDFADCVSFSNWKKQ